MNRSRFLLAVLVGSATCLLGPASGAESISNTQAVVRAAATVAVPAAPPAPVESVDACLSWDGVVKTLTVTNGTPEAHFTFNFTNVSSGDVSITSASGSCFCTVAKLPDLPWKIAPGVAGQIPVVMNLAGKSGTLPKTVTVVTDKGAKMLYVTATVLPPPAPPQMAAADREKNQKVAIVDRQAVFRGECAKCHAEPARNKIGQALFVSVCGVCHEGEHRASMVPNLHAIQQETNAEFWRNWITHGKPASLMPAFSQAEGGILSNPQIDSLVSYLTVAIPSKPPTQLVKPQAKSN